MKTSALALLASAAVMASAQATYNSSTGQFVCAKPSVNYCGSGSLESDIIIRCDENGVGQTGRCSDNLAGQPPLGNTPALCWETSETSGDAACEKNCVVYGSTTSTLDASVCTPTYTASGGASSTASSSSTPVPWVLPSSSGSSGNTTSTSTATSTSSSAVVTAGGAVNNAGGLLAGAGLLAAYLL